MKRNLKGEEKRSIYKINYGLSTTRFQDHVTEAVHDERWGVNTIRSGFARHIINEKDSVTKNTLELVRHVSTNWTPGRILERRQNC